VANPATLIGRKPFQKSSRDLLADDGDLERPKNVIKSISGRLVSLLRRYSRRNQNFLYDEIIFHIDNAERIKNRAIELQEHISSNTPLTISNGILFPNKNNEVLTGGPKGGSIFKGDPPQGTNRGPVFNTKFLFSKSENTAIVNNAIYRSGRKFEQSRCRNL